MKYIDTDEVRRFAAITAKPLHGLYGLEFLDGSSTVRYLDMIVPGLHYRGMNGEVFMHTDYEAPKPKRATPAGDVFFGLISDLINLR